MKCIKIKEVFDCITEFSLDSNDASYLNRIMIFLKQLNISLVSINVT